MPTDPPKNARQRARERIQAQRAAAEPDADLPTPPKTPRVRGSDGAKRTKARAERTATVTNLFQGTEEGVDQVDHRAKVPTRAEVRKNTQRRPMMMGRRWQEVVDRIRANEYTWDEFCEALSPEELARGQLKDDRGRFTGRPPEFVPRAFLLQCQREIFRRFNEKMQSRVLAATDEYLELSKAVEDPNTREKMLRYIMERVMGPVPKEVVVSTEKPYEGLLAKVASRSRDIEQGEDRYASRRDDG